MGLSFLSGDHMVLIPKVMKRLKDKKVGDVMVVVGGIILKRQVPTLMEMGVQKVFLPGIPPDEIVQYIQEKAAQ